MKNLYFHYKACLLKAKKILLFSSSILFGFFLLNGCSESRETAEKMSLKEKTKPPQPVIIRGITDDPGAFAFANFIDYSNFKGTNISDDYPVEIAFDDYLVFKWDSIRHPQIIELFAIGDSAYYNTRMFIRPGDSISLLIKNKTIQFEDKNAAQFNFFNQLDPLSNEWASIKFKGSLSAYKRQADDLSEYNTNKENIVHLIAKDWGNDNEILFDFDNYFEGVSLSDFKRPELLSNDYFRRGLIEFIRYFFVHNESITFSMDNFEKEKKFIEKHFEGDLMDFAVTSLFYDYHQKGLGQGEAERPILKSRLSEEKSRVKDSTLIEVLDRLDEKLSILGSPFFKSEVKDEFVSLTGDTLSVNSMLNKTPNKIIYVDYWASWCGPCRRLMPATRKLKEHYKNQEVVFVYLSIDEDKNKWLKASRNEKIDNYEHNYLIINHNATNLDNKLKILSITRYLIYDKKGRLVNHDAPNPETFEIKVVLNTLINKK